MWCASYAGRSISENLFQLGRPLLYRVGAGLSSRTMSPLESGTSTWKGHNMAAPPTGTMSEWLWKLLLDAATVLEGLWAAAELVLCTYPN